MGGESLFDNIQKNDLIFAFFPCTRFEAKIPLAFRGEAFQQKNWSDEKKLEYSITLHKELSELYELISMLAIVVIRKQLHMIIENPYTQPHYLTTYWCIKPALVDKDRTNRGDHMKKPTQYFFINCEPKKNFIWEPQILNEVWTVENPKGCQIQFEKSRKTARSMISKDYANRFIREFILDDVKWMNGNE